jgi:hypothetical protein
LSIQNPGSIGQYDMSDVNNLIVESIKAKLEILKGGSDDEDE